MLCSKFAAGCVAVLMLLLPGTSAFAQGPTFPRGTAHSRYFSQTFYTAPGSEWTTSVAGAGRFVWHTSGPLEVVTVNNTGAQIDEFYRLRDVPTVTQAHDFAFTGEFKITSATLAVGNRAAVLLGLGSSTLASGSFRQGVAVHIEAGPTTNTMQVRARLGAGLQELRGTTVPVARNVNYKILVKHFINAGSQWVLAAEVWNTSGALVGVSQAINTTGLGFSANRIYFANDTTLSDGGRLAVEWWHVGIEREIQPIHATPFYQSPVCLDPDDLMQFCGYWLTSDTMVLYQKVANSTNPPLSPPVGALTTTTADVGSLRIVSTHGVPCSVVGLVPKCLIAGQCYALWVGHPNRGWSRTILVNDARPFWISPELAYPNDEVKIVGRNLDPFPETPGTTRVRLTGPSVYTLTAANDHISTTGIEKYAAKITLPAGTTPGTYTVTVCRDGISWVPLVGKNLIVRPIPPPPLRFNVLDYGAIPNDGLEDTDAITSAIAACATSGGGEVYLPAGTYNIRSVELTSGVSLAGAGMDLTRLSDAHPDPEPNLWPIVRARGHQTIHDLEFYDPLGGLRTVGFQSYGIALGWENPWVLPCPPAEEITVRSCRFNRCYCGIIHWATPIRHCWITQNEFRTMMIAVPLFPYNNSGDLTDLRITNNLFYPSANELWNYPSELSGCEAVDFSDNVFDGTVNGGWRNGAFWDLSHGNRMVLISSNRMTCTGDKGSGYGEGISFDGNGDTIACRPLACDRATTDSATIPAGWTVADQFAGFWVRIVEGKGLGQSRQITSHTSGTLNLLKIAQSWDVLPDAGSHLVVSKQYWSTFVVDNQVDQRPRLTNNMAGEIGPLGSTSDCVWDGNRQYDCTGMSLIGYCLTYGSQYGFGFQYFSEVRKNLLEGEVGDFGAGIALLYSTDSAAPTPLLGYGTVVTGNTIRKSEYNINYGSGAILTAGWGTPSTPYTWKEPLIYGNKISEVPLGIILVQPYIWNSVIYNNVYGLVGQPVKDNGTATVLLESFPPRTIYVDDDNTTEPEYGTLQFPCKTFGLATFFVYSGDTISVAPGTYQESFGLGGRDHCNLTVQGAGPELSIIRGCVNMNRIRGSRLRGFTIWSSLSDYGIALDTVSSVTISDNVFSGNSRHGLISRWSSVTIVNNTFTSNGVTGIYLQLPTTATVANNIITKNGTFGIRADRSPSLLVMQNTITSNSLGVQVSGNSRARVLNNVFDGNGNGAVSLQSALDVVNNTFVRHPQFVMSFTSSSTGIVSNNIVADCSFAVIGWDPSSSVMVDYNDFWNNTINAYPGPNGMQQDPLFVDLAQGNLHLRRGSPCIDRGTSVGAPATDFEGDPRPQWFGVDIGADESPYNGRIPPTGSITVNGGATYSSSTAVILMLSATDDGVVGSMRFSNNGTAWGAWENYATTKTWTLLAGDGGKSVYTQFKDTANNVSRTSSDTITLDMTAPAGNVTINSGATYATTTAATLDLSATDSLSGVSRARYSNDGSTWSGWQGYVTSRPWSLTSGDGTKTVYVRFHDAAGNDSAVYTDTIILDTVGPAGSILINSGATTSTTPFVMLTLSATDARSGAAQMRFSNSGTAWTAWENYTTTRPWTVSAGDGLKTVYVQFRDGAGNTSAVYSDVIQLDTRRTASRRWRLWR